ncbi:hypothetical protein [uncultured Flavobacterium sp.]|uniref:hypothetical protein n=1 Tax=uncultured Flavobacterium sp. TaxID=165435 RepID=UPI0030EDF55B
MVFAGFRHLTFNRIDFQSQVLDWVPLSKDLVVVLFGVDEKATGSHPFGTLVLRCMAVVEKFLKVTNVHNQKLI